jgi:hypothetical protein
VTSPHEFLVKKRQERTRGKLAGLENQIRELKDLGASYKEIAEYLHLEHGLTVTRGGLQQHLKSLATKRPARLATEVSSSAPKQPPPPHIPPPEKASTPSESFRERHPMEGSRIQTRAESSEEFVATRYSLGSPEHQEALAAYRRRKHQSQT